MIRPGFLLLLLLPTSALAQAPAPATSPPPKAQAPGGFSPLGDPARFTRLGGWGGLGGMAGQFGLARATLVTMPAVQKDLKLTPAQVKALADWQGEMRKRGEARFRPPTPTPPAIAVATDPDLPAAPVEPAPAPVPREMPNPIAMLEMVAGLVKEGEAGLAKILDKGQAARLEQIALQMQGLSALGRDDVAEAVNLSVDQIEGVHQILAESRNDQLGLILRQAIARPAVRGGEAPTAGEADQAVPKKRAADEPPEARAKRREADRARATADFARFRDGSDAIQGSTTAKLLKLLTRKQRERFDKLLGPPFDPAKLLGPGGPPRPDLAKPVDPPKPAEPARSTRLRDLRSGAEAKPKG